MRGYCNSEALENRGGVAALTAEIGSTDISAIGDGSLTGAISTVNSNVEGIKPITMNLPANGTITFSPSGSTWMYAVCARAWATDVRQISIISGYVTSSRTNVDTIVGSVGTIFTVSGSTSSKEYTFTSNLSIDAALSVLKIFDI